ncbi:MAG TPA: phosphoglucosamine mutase [Vicinamibacteria bacterium]|nr:phosphoglucosamine mutase [Vicinamibacteria bacterium]HRB11728.1 phosphoglucosamine mutase [Vicinamibacteria bacterium]
MAKAKKPEARAETRLFGTDGVRGVANLDPMTPEIALKIGQAAVVVAAGGLKHAPRVLIGKDTRLSGYMIETALASGICSVGGNVLLCGPIPTPAVAHLTTSMRADLGIVISASHNPFQDNGIKIFGRDGFKLADELEARIEGIVRGTIQLPPRKTGPGIGQAFKVDDARGRYVAFAKNTFPRAISLEGLRLVVDAAHGAAYRVAPAVFSELGATVKSIGVQPDGVNINEGVGALHPDKVRAEVVKASAQMGIALDGDADRVILVDERGQVVDGDSVLAMCALEMAETGLLKKSTVVATVMSNLGLERALAQRKIRLVRTAVGDRHVVDAMRKGGFNLGGEQSGHLVFLDHASTGDGIVAALQVLALMIRKEKPLSELAAAAMVRVPQVLESVVLPRRRPIEEMKKLQTAMRSVSKSLGRKGRILVRWSGTEAKLRVMIEGENEAAIGRHAESLVAAARQDFGVRA